MKSALCLSETSAPFGSNPMIEGPLRKVFSEIDRAVTWLEQRFDNQSRGGRLARRRGTG